MKGIAMTTEVTSLIGYWKLKSCDAIPNVVVTGIATSYDGVMEFTKNGRYVVYDEDDFPSTYLYHCDDSSPPKLEIWMAGWPDKTNCLYRLKGQVLQICAAFNHGPHPTDIHRNDQSLWGIFEFERYDGPLPNFKKTRAMLRKQKKRS